MRVRDLITELLDYDMEREVQIVIEGKGNDEVFEDFNVEEEKYSVYAALNLTVKTNKFSVVDADDYERLQDEKEDLENSVKYLEEQLESAEERIDELEKELEK